MGGGTAKNDTEAKKWLERAAANGHVAAEYELGIALRDGRGTVQDYKRAAAWMRSAAEGGHPPAQLALGLMYRFGTGVPTDNVRAYTWLNIAAARRCLGGNRCPRCGLESPLPQDVADAQAEAKRLSEVIPPPPTSTTQ